MKTILVGNGPSLLGSGFGKLIDGFDCVARFNAFRIGGFEEDVGTRVDVWLTHEGYLAGDVKWVQSFPQCRTVVLAPYFPERLARMASSALLRRSEVHLVSDLEAQLISKHWDRTATGSMSTYVWPSSGLMAVLLLRPCAIVGFDHFEGPAQHYWDDGSSLDAYHQRERERGIVDQLVSAGEVVRYR